MLIFSLHNRHSNGQEKKLNSDNTSSDILTVTQYPHGLSVTRRVYNTQEGTNFTHNNVAEVETKRA